MNIGAILVGFGLLVVVVAYVARPLFDQGSANGHIEGPQIGSAAPLTSQRDAIYALIRELDSDFETGKITERDYRAYRERYVAEGVAILKQLDALAGDDRQAALEVEIEQRVLALRKASATAPDLREQTANQFCTQCGHPFDPEDRFCAQCGASLRGMPS